MMTPSEYVAAFEDMAAQLPSRLAAWRAGGPAHDSPFWKEMYELLADRSPRLKEILKQGDQELVWRLVNAHQSLLDAADASALADLAKGSKPQCLAAPLGTPAPGCHAPQLCDACRLGNEVALSRQLRDQLDFLPTSDFAAFHTVFRECADQIAISLLRFLRNYPHED